MAWWSNLAGTASGYFRLGLTGVRLKNSTGLLALRNAGDTAAAGVSAVMFESPTAIAANYTVATGNNAVSPGPVTINSGVTVTVPSGSRWVIV